MTIQRPSLGLIVAALVVLSAVAAASVDRRPPCFNGALDNGETDTDCGGPNGCRRCAVGRACRESEDCADEAECSHAGFCVDHAPTRAKRSEIPAPADKDNDPEAPPRCFNLRRDPDESDVDCGGPSECARCEIGQRCGAASDCSDNNVCRDHVCASPRLRAVPSGSQAVSSSSSEGEVDVCLPETTAQCVNMPSGTFLTLTAELNTEIWYVWPEAAYTRVVYDNAAGTEIWTRGHFVCRTTNSSSWIFTLIRTSPSALNVSLVATRNADATWTVRTRRPCQYRNFASPVISTIKTIVGGCVGIEIDQRECATNFDNCNSQCQCTNNTSHTTPLQLWCVANTVPVLVKFNLNPSVAVQYNDSQIVALVTKSVHDATGVPEANIVVVIVHQGSRKRAPTVQAQVTLTSGSTSGGTPSQAADTLAQEMTSSNSTFSNSTIAGFVSSIPAIDYGLPGPDRNDQIVKISAGLCPNVGITAHNFAPEPPSVYVTSSGGDVSVKLVMTADSNRYFTRTPYFIGNTGPAGINFTVNATLEVCYHVWRETFALDRLLTYGSPVRSDYADHIAFDFRVVLEFYEEFNWTQTVSRTRLVQSPVKFTVVVPRMVSVTTNITLASSRVLWAYIERSFVSLDLAGVTYFDIELVTRPVEDNLVIDPATFVIASHHGDLQQVSQPALYRADGQMQYWRTRVTLTNTTICQLTKLDNFTASFSLEMADPNGQPQFSTGGPFSVDFTLETTENWCAQQAYNVTTPTPVLATYNSDSWLVKTSRFFVGGDVYADVYVPDFLTLHPIATELVGLEVGGRALLVGGNATALGTAFGLWIGAPGDCLDSTRACWTFTLLPTNFTGGTMVPLAAQVKFTLQEGRRRSEQEVYEKTVTAYLYLGARGKNTAAGGDKAAEGQQQVTVTKFASNGALAILGALVVVPVVALAVGLAVVLRRRS
eukprot:m51a1_g4615 hypothetical protein (939) ;mRNA; r:273319-276839